LIKFAIETKTQNKTNGKHTWSGRTTANNSYVTAITYRRKSRFLSRSLFF